MRHFWRLVFPLLHVHIKRILIADNNNLWNKKKAVVEGNCLNKIRITCVCGDWAAPAKNGWEGIMYKRGIWCGSIHGLKYAFLGRSNCQSFNKIHKVHANHGMVENVLCFDLRIIVHKSFFLFSYKMFYLQLCFFFSSLCFEFGYIVACKLFALYVNVWIFYLVAFLAKSTYA